MKRRRRPRRSRSSDDDQRVPTERECYLFVIGLVAVSSFSLSCRAQISERPTTERGETPAVPTRHPHATQPALPGRRRRRPHPRSPRRTRLRIRRPPSIARSRKPCGYRPRSPGRQRHPGGQLGQDRRVRKRRRLEHQHRQRLLRRPAAQPHHLARLRRPRPAPPGQQSHPDRYRREGPRPAGLGRLASLLTQGRHPLDRL